MVVGSDLDFLEENEIEDDQGEDAEQNQYVSQPLQIVLKELEKLEQLLQPSRVPSSSQIHPTHVAAYLRAMRLCTAWSYLIIACVPNRQLVEKNLLSQNLSNRVHSALLRFAIIYCRSLLNEAEASKIVAVLEKFLPPPSSSTNQEKDEKSEKQQNISTTTTIVPSEPRSVFVYSALVPMLENIAVAFTLEKIVVLKKNQNDDDKLNNNNIENNQSNINNEDDYADIWKLLVDLIETRLGWSQSPYGCKYRLYIANPTQCLLAPTEQPL